MTSAFVPLNSGAQAQIVFTLDSKVVENRLWFLFDNPPFGSLELTGLAAGLYNWHTTKVLPYLSSDLQLAAVEVFDWTADPSPTIVVAGPPINGGVAEKSYSANVATRVNLRWPRAFRERMNCNFVPGLPDSAVTLNTLDPTFRNRIWEAYADLIDDTRLFAPVLNWRWVVASAIDAGTLRSELLVGECIGPVEEEKLKLGQRRKRMP